VLIPEENAKDLVEISDSIKKGLDIVPVSRMDEVLARAMTRKPEPIEWEETTTTAAAVPEEAPVEDVHRALNDRDTGAAVISQNFILCVPKIRFCNIGDEVRRGQVVM
jgi:hypothetical protein